MRHRVRVCADAAGRMIGFGMSGASLPDAFGEPPRERQLYTLYVLAEAHGTGVGQALLDVILGPAPALLWVAQENPRAIAFYRRNGFGFDGTTLTDPALPALVEARMVR